MLLANADGQRILDGRVDRVEHFRGPPIIVFAAELRDDDRRWVAALEFATALRAPLIGTDGASASLTLIEHGLTILRRWWRSDRGGPPDLVLVFDRRTWGSPPAWGVGTWNEPHSPPVTRTVTPMFCGPILLMPRSTEENLRPIAWAWAQRVARSTEYHPYGIGMYAVSHFVLWYSPPMYPIPVVADYKKRLDTLRKTWLAPPEPSVDQYEALAAAEVPRSGLARLIHPSLVGIVDLG